MIELLNCDCMEYMKGLEDNAFDLAIVDPPYGRGEHGGTSRTHNVRQKNGKMLVCRDGGYARKNWDNAPPKADYYASLERVSKHQIIWGFNYCPVHFKGGGVIVWDKVNDGADQSGCELAYCSLNQRVDIVRYMWRGMMQGKSIHNGTIQQGNKSLNEKRIHPTQKPVKLYDWILAKYAKEGDRILDTHLGSGSSAIAAHYGGFEFVGMEIDKDYYDAAVKRFNSETAQVDMFGGCDP
ncbi:MAG: site-specific DNA-methyltransferase [Planctomycetaceae bacterium]|nr:site-specific DNA-methyltransferase [Planctomycetaceae bacterium]